MSAREPNTPLENPLYEAVAQLIAKELREHERIYHNQANLTPYQAGRIAALREFQNTPTGAVGPAMGPTEAQRELIHAHKDRDTKRTVWGWAFFSGWLAMLCGAFLYAALPTYTTMALELFLVVCMLCVVTWNPGHKDYSAAKKGPRK